MFCPFTNGDCEPDCIFNNGAYDENDPENCNLMDAIRNIQSDGFDDRTPRSFFDNFESDLASIRSNTGSDQTESYSINSTLEDIKGLLKDIKKKL